MSETECRLQKIKDLRTIFLAIKNDCNSQIEDETVFRCAILNIMKGLEIAITFFSQIVSAIMALVAIRMYSEFLNPSELGEAMLALGGIALFDAVFSSSISQVVFYYGSKSQLQTKIYGKITQLSKYSIIFGGIFLLTIIVLLSIPIVRIEKWEAVALLAFSYLVIEPSKSSLFSFLNIISSRQKYGFQVIIEAISTLLICFFALNYESNWLFLIFGIILARYLSIFSNSLLLKSSLPKLSSKAFEGEISVTEILSHMKPVMFMGLLGWLSAFADRYIVAGALNIKQTGYYSVATGLAGKPYNILTSALTAYFRPSLYLGYAANDLSMIKRNYTSWLGVAVILGSIGGVLFYFIGPFMVKLLLAHEYRGQVESILWILAISMTLSITTHVFDNQFLAKGLGKKLFLLQMCLSPMSLICIGLGAYFKGIEGAATGKLIADLTKLASTFIYSKRIKL